MSRPKRPWFRFYTEAVYDRKLRSVAPETRWLFVVVLALARQSPIAGWLMLTEQKPLTLADVADAAAMPERKVKAGMAILVDLGIVAFEPNIDTWSVPKWSERQFESDDVVKRTRKHRSKERSQDVPGNPPESEAETDTPTSPPVKPRLGSVDKRGKGGKPVDSFAVGKCQVCDDHGMVIHEGTDVAVPCVSCGVIRGEGKAS